MISQVSGFPKCSSTCPRVTELEKENEELKEKLAARDEKIKRLQGKLRKHENPHTPPSKKLGSSKSKSSKSKSQRNKLGERDSGRREDHEGVTRSQAEPDRTIVVEEENCSHCGAKLGESERTETRVIEDIADPQPVEVTEHEIDHYECGSCGEEVVAGHEDLPPEGRLGYNAVVQTTLYKYRGRSVHRRTRDLLEWQHGLELSSATVFDLTRRASDWLRPQYEKVVKRIRKASILYVDETGMKVDGEKGWIWTFVADDAVLFAMRMSRGKKVLKEVLGDDFKGKIVSDGWRSYPAFTSNLQRCWAHLLREADELKDKNENGKQISDELHRLYDELTDFVEGDPPPDERKKKKDEAEEALKELINADYKDEDVIDFAAKVENGIDHWLTFLTNPELEPTNNRAERALREHVVQRKIIGTLRNEKGMRIHETIMTMLATWEQNNLDPCEEMLKDFRNHS